MSFDINAFLKVIFDCFNNIVIRYWFKRKTFTTIIFHSLNFPTTRINGFIYIMPEAIVRNFPSCSCSEYFRKYRWKSQGGSKIQLTRKCTYKKLENITSTSGFTPSTLCCFLSFLSWSPSLFLRDVLFEWSSWMCLSRIFPTQTTSWKPRFTIF